MSGFSARGRYQRGDCPAGGKHSFGTPFGRDGVVISWCKNCDYFTWRYGGKYDRDTINNAIGEFKEWRKTQ